MGYIIGICLILCVCVVCDDCYKYVINMYITLTKLLKFMQETVIFCVRSVCKCIIYVCICKITKQIFPFSSLLELPIHRPVIKHVNEALAANGWSAHQ